MVREIARVLGERAILAGERVDDVVDRLERVPEAGGVPVPQLHQVVATLLACLGGQGWREVGVRGSRCEEVDRDLDGVGRGPVLDHLAHRLVGAGHPVVPKRHAQGSCGVGGPDVR